MKSEGKIRVKGSSWEAVAVAQVVEMRTEKWTGSRTINWKGAIGDEGLLNV